MKQMILRDGQAAALEAVLTLPIRQCPWSIVPTKGDKGEAGAGNACPDACVIDAADQGTGAEDFEAESEQIKLSRTVRGEEVSIRSSAVEDAVCTVE